MGGINILCGDQITPQKSCIGRERERETDRQTDRQTERQRDRAGKNNNFPTSFDRGLLQGNFLKF